MKTALLTAAGNPVNQDRGLIIQVGPRLVLGIADGAGGRSGGVEAAGMAVELVQQNSHLLINAGACAEVLRKMDTAIAKNSAAGETTCALAIVAPEEIFGASVGDSGIWLIPPEGNHFDLTHGQQRKPFIGSGGAWPVSFQFSRQTGTLLLATDGLLKYTSAERIVANVRGRQTETAEELIELVRYPSGALPDDVTVIICPLT